MAKVFAIMAVFSVAMALLTFAVALQHIEENEKLRRWERKCNRIYRENPDAVLGR